MTATEEACARYRRHEYAQALTDFADCLTADPDDYGAVLGTGRCHRLLGALDAAVDDFAELYLFTGRPAEALAISREAMADEPGDMMHRINIAHAHLLLGQVGTALTQYRALAPELHPVKQRSGAQLIEQDLRLLAAAGVPIPTAAWSMPIPNSGNIPDRGTRPHRRRGDQGVAA